MIPIKRGGSRLPFLKGSNVNMARDALFIVDITSTHSALIPSFFPAARDLKQGAAIYAAINADDPGTLLGAALLAAPGAIEAPPFLCDIFVLEQWRNHGVGQALIRYLIDTARKLRAPALRLLNPIENSGVGAMLERHGFNNVRSTRSYCFSLLENFSMFDELLQASQLAARIPDKIEMLPYSSSREYAQLSKLCQQEFGLLTHGHLKASGQYPADGRNYRHSTIFKQESRLIGAWGVGTKERTAVFDPLLIAPEKRSSWVFPLVIHRVLGKLLASGIAHGVAQIHQDNAKMIALMKRIGAQSLKVEHLYELPLEYSGHS